MAFCSSCGSQVSDNEKFCPSCGTPVESEQVQSSNSQGKENKVGGFIEKLKSSEILEKIKNFDYKKYLKPAIAAVIALVVIIVAVNVVSGMKYETQKHVIQHYYNSSDEETVLYLDGKKETKVDGSVYRYQNNYKGDVMAFLVEEEDDDEDYSYSSTYTLYRYDGKLKKVADEVSYFMISSNGKSIAYTTDEEETDYGVTTYTLMLWKGGKSKEVANDVTENFFISPNGKTVAYSVSEFDEDAQKEYEELQENEPEYPEYPSSSDYYDDDYNFDEDGYDEAMDAYYDASDSYDEDYEEWQNKLDDLQESITSGESFVWKNKAKSVGEVEILAVTDNYKYIYYNKDGNTYVQKGLKSDKKVKMGEADSVSYLIFNKKMTECFYSEGGKSKIIKKAKEVKTLKDSGFPLFPESTAGATLGSDTVIMAGLTTFKDTFYGSGDTVYHINNKFEPEKVAKCDSAQLADDGKTIIFIKDSGKDGEIYKINGKKSGAEPKLLVS
ncbi:MAG: zinc ribbon domain-containing protein, partial [Oscillospiraceae bacterium]|nr:zinc ribbon domain-containing protein [Oscillospiraceae bacterium]